MICPSCGADLPDDARFCIECGVAVTPAATDATIKLPAREAMLACRACGAPNPPDALFCVRCGQRHGAQPPGRVEPPAPLAPPTPAPRRRRMRAGQRAAFLLPALLLIGLGASILIGRSFLWPMLLTVFAVLAFVYEANRGLTARALTILVWGLGLIVAFMLPRLFLPIVLLMVGVSVVLNMVRRP